MLKTLNIQNFTAFKRAEFEFSEGLNVIVGDNGTGKTHLLKLGYLFGDAWSGMQERRLRMTQQRAESFLEERISGLFRVNDLARLIRVAGQEGTTLAAHVEGFIPTAQFKVKGEPATLPESREAMPWAVRIAPSAGEASRTTSELICDQIPDGAAVNAFVPRQIFIPSKEIVSLFKGLAGLFETYQDFPLDDTYRDLAALLSTLVPKEVPDLAFDAVQSIVDLVGGDLKLEEGDLVLVRKDGSRLLSQLLAEGHRKLAMLIYLLRHGLIERGSTLFWDEPEANLNPASLKLLIHLLHRLSGVGVQVILATHSLFLLREVEILQMNPTSRVIPAPRYFGLGLKGGEVVVTQGDEIAEIEPLVALDENLTQSDRYLEAEHAVSD